MTSSRRTTNKISLIIVEGKRVEKKEELIGTRKYYFVSLYTKEIWERPSLDNLEFEGIGEERALWLERKFEEEEVREAIHAMAEDKSPGPHGFPVAFPAFLGSYEGGYNGFHE